MRRNSRRSRSNFASETQPVSKEVHYHKPQPDEGINLGCVMLSKIRYYISDPSARVPMRCALGFAVRTDDDLCRCMEVSGPGDCWQETSGWKVLPLQVVDNSSADRTAEPPRAAGPENNGSVTESRSKKRPYKRRKKKKASTS